MTPVHVVRQRIHGGWRHVCNLCRTCHECGGAVQFHDTVCATCGVSHPVRIPQSLVLCGVALILVLTTLVSVGL